MKELKVLQAKAIERLAQIGSEITGLINTGTPCRIWNGEKDIVNPTTGEVLNKKRVTTNLDVVVPQALFESVSKALEVAKDSGKYVEISLGNQKLVAIASRHDEQNDRFIVQFSKPNTGSYLDSTSADFKAKLAEAFDVKMNAKANATKSDDDPGF